MVTVTVTDFQGFGHAIVNMNWALWKGAARDKSTGIKWSISVLKDAVPLIYV